MLQPHDDDHPMELRQLRYFTILAQELHFGRAAQRLAISQPPLSVAIKQLEEELGAQLFERNSKEVRITPAGEHLLPRALQLLEQSQQLAGEVQGVAKGQFGHLRIGFVASSIYRGLPQALLEMQAKLPQVQLEISELNTSEQVTAVSAGRLDLGLIHGQPLPSNLSSRELQREPFVCCMSNQHRLAKQSTLELGQLEGETLLLFSRQASPAYHEQILGLLRNAKVEPQHVHEVRHWLTVVALASKGIGVALVPAAMQRTKLPGTVFLPLAGKHPASTTLAIWRKAPANPVKRLFLQCLGNALRTMEEAESKSPAAWPPP
ncbi:LysR family transcriptional regulator [Lampropedia aestuarii]|uniref:LysR family transcriptional regulator n=1 Tax=Lampropedia aestuarii TaxID=2562762 RepID=UPI0024696A66|nr:LysR family transcriptional regulator [Lampropedia aestuarii]MDH5856042.1 LysR family transcriptional regulator [Lampropedia aestuarii]